jgi:phosphopantetheinyl transferase
MTRQIAVRCARVPLSLPAGIATRWLNVLPRRRKSALARRLSMRNGLASLTGLALLSSFSSDRQLPSIAQLRWKNSGKPYFPGGPDFSITHSAGFAACAIAPGNQAIGIDLEPVDRVRMAAIRLVANDGEFDALESGSMGAAHLWTAKEAVLKASGAELSDIGRVCVDGDRAHFGGADFRLQYFSLDGGLLLAIAMSRPIPKASIEWRSPSELFDVTA